jgi:molecular chaperone DnaK (HSP70)
MVRLGIDFGTTNTVASIYDRGIFSVVQHQTPTSAGTVIQEMFPSVMMLDRRTGQRWFGVEADRRFEESAGNGDRIFVTSLKRQLRDYVEGKKACASLCDGSELPFNMDELLTDFLRAVAESIRRSHSLDADEPLDAVITWPANANGAQRYVTRKCFRQAGFHILATVNEPTASAIELVDLFRAGKEKEESMAPGAIAVFDLGSGTFDASVVWVEGQEYRVLASGGIETLGGDDFDRVMVEMFLERLNRPVESMGALTHHAIMRQARSQKEMISAGSVKSLFFNPREYGLRGRSVSIPVEEYYERIRPMLAPAVAKMAEVITQGLNLRHARAAEESMTIYLVGGSSRLPLVGELISQAFHRHSVVLTDKPFRSVAMGAAICAMDRVTYQDVFSRHFGLIRLRDHGRAEMFDVIFPAGTPVPRRGESPLEKVRWYNPAHNIGHLRYLECTAVGPDGLPREGVREWSDILFPYDPACPLESSVSSGDIIATDRFAGLSVCESYRCDSDGVITVELRNPARDESRCYEIFNE